MTSESLSWALPLAWSSAVCQNPTQQPGIWLSPQPWLPGGPRLLPSSCLSGQRKEMRDALSSLTSSLKHLPQPEPPHRHLPCCLMWVSPCHDISLQAFFLSFQQRCRPLNNKAHLFRAPQVSFPVLYLASCWTLRCKNKSYSLCPQTAHAVVANGVAVS